MRVVLLAEAPGIDLEALQGELSPHGVELDARDPPPGPPSRESYHDWVDWMAWHAAFAKVRDLGSPPSHRGPADLEVEKEARALTGQRDPPGPLYDGPRMMEAYHGPLPEALSTPGEPVVVLTDRLIGTYEGDRYHVRFLVAGHPSIVSVPGFVDGPARDRSFYLAKQALGSGLEADAMVDDDRITRQDPRLPVCTASAVLQALLYAHGGDPFCEEASCRLYNPHWQEELVGSMATRTLCKQHEAWLAHEP